MTSRRRIGKLHSGTNRDGHHQCTFAHAVQCSAQIWTVLQYPESLINLS